VGKNIYFGALDTARTAILNADSSDYISLGEAKLKLAVLLGLTPVFPQTHGWDSAALLQYSGTDYRAGQDESEAFLWLVGEGFIRILLRQRHTPKSLLEAAFAGFEDEKYAYLAAWPEFNLGDPNKADRKAFVAAMRADKRGDVPPPLRKRGLALLRLSKAVQKATKPHTPRESPRGDLLRKEIETAAGAAKLLGEQMIADCLQRCVDLGSEDGNRREKIDDLLGKFRNESSLLQVRQITDACFNVVAAKCVGDALPELTFEDFGERARAVMQQTRSQASVLGNTFAGKIKAPQGAHLEDLKPLTWSNVRAFAEKHRSKEPFHSDRLVDLPDLIASVQVEGMEGWLLPLIGGFVASEGGRVATKKVSSRRAVLLRGVLALTGGFGGGKATHLVLNEKQYEIKNRWLDLLCLNE
jgi:hypothetical protein